MMDMIGTQQADFIGSQANKTFPCHLCGKIFRVKHQYIGHLNTHLNRKPFQCEFCEKCFAYATNLSRHRRTCENNPQNSLSTLNLHFSGSQGPWKLNFFHPASPNLNMFSPYESFSSILFPDLSENSTFFGQVEPYNLGSQQLVCNPTCRFCGKKFHNRSDCMGHINSVHLNTRPYVCKHCAVSYSYRQSLNRHLLCCKKNFLGWIFFVFRSL